MASHSGEDNNSQCVNDVHLQELASKLGKEWKTVGRNLGLKEAEIDQAECSNSKNVQEAINSVLQTWKRKTASGATYSVLAQHLEKANRKDLAEVVLQWWDMKPQKNIGNHSELFIKALKRTYERWLCMIRPNPTKKSQKWKLNDLFIDVGLALLDQTSYSKLDESWTSLKTYRALFANEELQEANKVIIEGEPGSGKTTLMYYLAYLWCTNDSQMKDVKYLILLPLRRVKHGSTIDKAIMDVLLRGSMLSISQTDIKRILESESSMVLALDGLDEYLGMEDNDCGEDGVMAILKETSNEVLPDVKVVVTTRPSCLPHTHECVASKVKLEKLQATHWEAYLKKVFPGESEEEHRRLIFEIIDTNYFIRAYCQLPLWFTLIVQIMRDDLKKSKDINLTRVTDLFEHILRGFRGHLINKEKPDTRDTDNPKLAEIAFSGLLRSSLKQMWKKEELADVDNYAKLVELGILVEEENLESDDLYFDANMAPKTVMFVHKTFQEWYGAKHLARLSNKPDIFTEILGEGLPFDDYTIFYFTCGISPQATKLLLEYYLSIKHYISDDRDFFFRCIQEYNGKECEIKELILQLCQKENEQTKPPMFELSDEREILLLKAKLTVLRMAHVFEVSVKHVFLECADLRCTPHDKIMIKGNIEIPPLPAKVITVYKNYGQPFFNFLKKCKNLEELRLDTDIFPGNPEEIRRRLQGKEVKVVWLRRKPYYGKFEQSYEMHGNEWEYISGRYCGHCDQSIKGVFWECRSCSKFFLCDNCKDHKRHANESHVLKRVQWTSTPNHCGHCDKVVNESFWECNTCSKLYLCDVCKDRGFHAHHSHRLGREFDERLLPKTATEWQRGNSPFVKILKRERYKILCSVCKETDVTIDGFECKICVNFYLCEVCRDKYPHSHLLSKRTYDLFKRCLHCTGSSPYGMLDYAVKRFKGYSLSCENCWRPPRILFRTSMKDMLTLSLLAEQLPTRKFKQRCCGGCGVQGENNDVWFKCETCPSVLLCGRCKDRGTHGEHRFHRQCYHATYCQRCGIFSSLMYRCNTCQGNFRCDSCRVICYLKRHEMYLVKDAELIDTSRYEWKISTLLPKTPTIHEDFQLRICKHCQVPGEINKVWFRCNTCPYFLLCGRCKDEGIHGQHRFNRQSFSDVSCEGCGIPLVLKYRCNTCFGKVLCIICQARWFHKGHEIEEIKETEIHHEGFECKYCCHPIFGTLYKCVSCKSNYQFCKDCKTKGVHPEQHNFKEERSKYEGIHHCEHCRKKIAGPAFRCQNCHMTRLCADCSSKGIHRNHEIREIQENEVHHIGVTCKECFCDVYGSRFRCITCNGYDICQDCKHSGKYPEHKLMEIKQAELYHDLRCDRCHAGIHDIRYKCKRCKKYNICKYCTTEDTCKGHQLLEAPFLVSQCTRCEGRTFGRRFFCESCRYITKLNLCEECMLIVTNEKNCQHEFVELRIKEVQHKYIHCNLCKEYQFRGIRYRCKTCKWYNLCEVCKEYGHHSHHDFEEWRTSQFLPGPLQLSYIHCEPTFGLM